ncbi:hypothetical protein SALBM311S_01237 [Streptomyces alboniger]
MRALHRDVQRYVAHLCGDPQAVDDLAQDTFLRALGQPAPVRGPFLGPRVAAVHRPPRGDRQLPARLRPAPGLSDVADWQLAVENAQPRDLPGFDDGVALLDLLASLPDERREAFILTQMVGLPYAEAAEAGDCPVGHGPFTRGPRPGDPDGSSRRGRHLPRPAGNAVATATVVWSAPELRLPRPRRGPDVSVRVWT